MDASEALTSGTKRTSKLWTERKQSLRHIRLLGCPVEAKVFNPRNEKLDPKTASCYFIGYIC
jgi:hypothetical protein